MTSKQYYTFMEELSRMALRGRFTYLPEDSIIIDYFRQNYELRNDKVRPLNELDIENKYVRYRIPAELCNELVAISRLRKLENKSYKKKRTSA